MKNYYKFIALWLVNLVLIYLFKLIFPINLTLGNSILEPYQAAVITSFVWNLILWNADSFFKSLDIDLDDPKRMAVGYTVINFAIVWLIARYSILSGIGISSYIYVLILAMIANFVQYIAWVQLSKKK